MKRTLLLLAALASTASANVKLPAIFTDHLVLQRGKSVSIWGWADPGEGVTVTFAGQTKKATAEQDGTWKVALDAMNANSEPAELPIQGKNQIVLKDVLVGEVWVCSGQSNMGMTVQNSKDAAQEIAAANFPQIRLYSVPLTPADEPQKDITKNPQPWKVCSPGTVGPFTAAGYFFGRELHQTLKVPIGLINTSWGGTRCEAWTSKSALEAVPTCKAIVTAWDEYLKTYNPETDHKRHDELKVLVDAKIAKAKEDNAKLAPGAPPQAVPTAMRPWDDQTKTQHRPAVLFNAMINPLVPYGIRGAIWYQGEANQGRAVQYLTLLPTMIKDWRTQWHDDFSFYIVQLASFGNGKSWPQTVGADDTWAELQWSQLQTAIKTPKCGLAVANDIGEEKDIHPKNKQEVGHRLALQALVKDYKKTELVSGGPIFAGGTTEASKFVINFSNAQNGLKSRDDGPLKGFTIAGADKVWKPAKAVVKNGKQVYVWNDEIKEPAAVRYAWASWLPEANLVNKEGLPTSVFRTDKWDLSTKGNESPFPAAKPAASARKKDVGSGLKEEGKPALKVDGTPAQAKKAAGQ